MSKSPANQGARASAAAARAQHVEQVIFPSLEAGHIVVCDRYVDSSIAYQGYGRKLGPEKIAELNELAVNGAIPDLTLLLNVPIEKGLRRRNKSLKPRDRLDLQQKEFYERVYVGYLELAQKNPQRYVVIDATKPIEQVGSEIWEVVRQKLQKHHGK
ncbi:MAG: thymidylate kinase [Candidatus Gottesmanbacteria bacterium GW2011_GWA1_42_26]|nr:MAG: thymidylate kinase [Candidatus Gottesmanbacteria bacterium GW2011_GWA1_42_26]